MKRFWRDLSLAYKLYVVVGVMGLLIALEFFALSFALETLSSVRAFVSGEALWSKAQKTAVLSLHKYAKTGERDHYLAYLDALQVPLGDRQARMELEKESPDMEVIYQGFVRGRIDEEDIPGLVKLVQRFSEVPQLRRALDIWAEGDRLLRLLTEEGSALHAAVGRGASQAELNAILARVDALDTELTEVEANFSYALGDASRWMERWLLIVLMVAVALFGFGGVYLTFSFLRNLRRDLQELEDTTVSIGQGDFSRRVPVRSEDDVGRLGVALNRMAEQLEFSVGEQKQAEKASEIKSQFLANMSHEIRTPLGAMLGFAELLRDRGLSPSEREAYIEIILRTGNNLSKVLNDVLDISKVEAGQMDVELVPCALMDILHEIRELMILKCASKGLRLELELAPNLPTRIKTDPYRLKQILINLISNSIKFTDHGKVRLSARLEGFDLLFSVADSGIGLTNAERGRLFQPFSQTNTAMNRKYEGTGLGLILSKRLANLMSGDVYLESSIPGQGSVFVARIPAHLPEFQIGASRDPNQSALPTERFEGKRVLVVDDTPDNRFLIEKILTRRGFHVEHAENGQEGVQKALRGDFDLVLMDVQMPVMDGYTAVRMLRQQHFGKPIIAVTAHAMKGDRMSCLDAGYSDYLTKPIQVNEFMKVLSQHLYA